MKYLFNFDIDEISAEDLRKISLMRRFPIRIKLLLFYVLLHQLPIHLHQ